MNKQKIIRLLCFMAVLAAGLLMLPDLLASVEEASEDAPSSVKSLMDILPIVYAAAIIVGAVSILAGGKIVYRYYKWTAYGNRLKEAYAAKFGGSNPAFNVEIDMHISAIRAMGRNSMTKQSTLDWLKRMAQFVEVPWAIPEEERLSEVAKTELYDEDNES